MNYDVISILSIHFYTLKRDLQQVPSHFRNAGTYFVFDN